MKWRQIFSSPQLPLVLLCAMLLPFFALTFFTYPVSDDYAFFADNRIRSFSEFMQWGYTTISGRYTAIAVTSLINPLYSQGFWYYRLFSLAILVAFTHSAYWFFKLAIARFGIKENVPLIAAIMVLYLWILMPNLCELIYWYSSANSYTVGLISFFYFGGILLKIKDSSRVLTSFTKTALIVALCFLLIVIIGTCEVALLLMLAFAFVLFIYHVINKVKPPSYYYILLALIVISSLVALLAPGNFHRSKGVAELYVNTPMHNLTFAFNTTFDKSIEIIFDYFLFNLFTLFIVLILAVFTPQYTPSENVQKLAKYMLFGSLVVVPMLLFPYYWSTGLVFIPLRIVNFCFIGFSLLYIPALYVFYKPYFSSRWQSKKVKYTILVATFALMGLRSNIRYAITDLYHINTYKTEVENRYAKLKESRGLDVEFTPLSYKPNTILHADLDAKPGHWYNRGLAAYYGVKSITVKK